MTTSPEDAAAFASIGIDADDAQLWIAAGIAADDAVEFIERGVSLEQAVEFVERDIEPYQVTRTESGFELDLEPWQVDPAEQLPDVIEPGQIDITLWTSAASDSPKAHVVTFVWDGAHRAQWYEDISSENEGLSVMSSSPTRGVLAWPDGADVQLTYSWSDMGLRGHERFSGLAPGDDTPATSPQFWSSLAGTLIDFVLLDLGSGGHDPGDNVTYLDDDEAVELDDLFDEYLASDAASRQSFEAWLDEAVATGRYTIAEDEGY